MTVEESKAVEESVLALGSHGSRAWELAERASELGFRAVLAKTPQDAIDLVADRGFRFAAALVDSEFPATNLRDALKTVRVQLDSRNLIFLATGPRLDRFALAPWRDAGVKLALWDPVGDHTLRFQLNRAYAAAQARVPRGELRIPTEWHARVFVAGRTKSVEVYSLSGGGAYLATRQPCMKGAEITVKLPLRERSVMLESEVIYTNVPGNLRSDKLPDGMAIRFANSGGPGIEIIRETVAETAATLVL